MRTSKNLVIIGLVVLVAVFLAAPSAFAKKKLADDELDLITAAGEPTIVQSTTGSISFSDDADAVLSFDTDTQSNAQGLVINNLTGENQIATALNIASVVFVNGPSQTNSITQSWGATKDWTAISVAPVTVSVPGVTAAISAAAASSAVGGSAVATQTKTATNNFCSTDTGEVKCAANKQGPSANLIGDTEAHGGAAAAAASTSASTSAASGAVAISEAKIAVLTMYADQIIDSTAGDIFVTRQISPMLTFDNGAQANLAALVLNNVAGLNQVATAINILGGGVTLSPLALATSQQDFGTSSQSNTIVQYRGTPLSRPEAPIK